MTDHLQPYPEYRDSGVEWLGAIPAHWEATKLKNTADNVNIQTDSSLASGKYIALENVESWTGKLRLPAEAAHFDSSVKQFRLGDILFGKLRPYLAKVARPGFDGVCVGEFLVIRAHEKIIASTMLEQIMRSTEFIDLGCVCKLEVKHDGSKINGSKEGVGTFVEAGGNGTELLEPGKEALDVVALLVTLDIVGTTTRLVRLARNDRLDTAPPQEGAESTRAVGFIRSQIAGTQFRPTRPTVVDSASL